MDQFLTYTVLGIVFGAIYAIAASGLVITYATSNVFNMAHGAIAMIMSFVYWELSVNRNIPTFFALVLTLAIAAAVGALLERFIMRRLVGADVVQSLTVTVGLLVLGIGVAQTIWQPEGRNVQPFFGDNVVRLAGVNVSWHQIIILLVAIAVAGGMYLLLNTTRMGIAMRAIVDNRTLLSLHGAKPDRLSMFSWSLGSMLAAVAGILLVSDVGLEYTVLTFLVLTTFAAAVVGRLTSLPLTFLGAMILGLVQNYYLWLSINFFPGFSPSFEGVLAGLRASVPTLLLFGVMLVLPQEKLRVGTVEGATLTKMPTRRRSLVWGGIFVIAVVFITGFLSNANIFSFGQAIGFATIMLSLVLLTGYGGDISLGQMAFAGVGALVVARGLPFAERIPFLPDGGTVNIRSIIVAGVVSGIVGLAIGIPALRLRGLYLGLATLAFAIAMDQMFFGSDYAFKLGGSLEVARPSYFGISLAGERAFAITIAIMFVALSFGVLEFRRSKYGRLLLATRDSPAACGTLGLSITRTRVSVFAASSALAGVGGALLSGMTSAASASDYGLLQASLPLLLLAVVGGITSPTGALLGGMFLGLGNTFSDLLPGGGSTFLATGLAAVAIAYFPRGLASGIFNLPKRLGIASDESAVVMTVDDLNELDELAKEVVTVGAS